MKRDHIMLLVVGAFLVARSATGRDSESTAQSAIERRLANETGWNDDPYAFLGCEVRKTFFDGSRYRISIERLDGTKLACILDDPSAEKLAIELVTDDAHSEEVVRVISAAMKKRNLSASLLAVYVIDGEEGGVTSLGRRIVAVAPTLPAVAVKTRDGWTVLLGALAGMAGRYWQ